MFDILYRKSKALHGKNRFVNDFGLHLRTAKRPQIWPYCPFLITKKLPKAKQKGWSLGTIRILLSPKAKSQAKDKRAKDRQ
jgi:hypothetical protein